MKKLITLFIPLIVFLLISCTIETDAVTPKSDETETTDTTDTTDTADTTDTTDTADAVETTDVVSAEREWTVVVYMAADNNLENAGLSDLNEMEGADYDHEKISVLALLDRSENYDTTNGNWSDTRLFEVQKDKVGFNSTIVSKQLDCPELSLTADSCTELDMGNKNVLSSLLLFAKNNYPSKKIALIMWGHGTGWRGDASQSETDCSIVRAFAIDDSDNSYLSVSDIPSAVTGAFGENKIDLFGFDTCFGVTLETAYEIRDSACFMIGTPGIEPAGGWDYTMILEKFSKTTLSTDDFVDGIISQYKSLYSGVSYSCISCIDLSKVENLFTSFDNFTSAVSKKITTETVKNNVKNALENSTTAYYASYYPTDYYIDVKNMTEQLVNIFPTTVSLAIDVCTNVALAVPKSYSSFSQNDSPYCIGVFYSQYIAQKITAAYFPTEYVSGSRVSNQTEFVLNSKGYVPTVNCSGSLLDKLFYTEY